MNGKMRVLQCLNFKMLKKKKLTCQFGSSKFIKINFLNCNNILNVMLTLYLNLDLTAGNMI